MFLKPLVHIYRKHKIKALANSPYPQDIFLFVTGGCNSRCPHCFYWQKDLKGELTDDQLLKSINSLPAKTNSICLTGGEPTLRKKIVTIVKHSLHKAENVTICTNGILFNKIEEIASLFINERQRLNFQISIDGDEETHDRIRGKGAYKAAMDSIAWLHQNNFFVIAVMTISKLNYTKIEDVFKSLNRLVSEIRINIVRSSANSVWNLPAAKLNISHNPRDDQIALPLQVLIAIRDRLLEITHKYPLWRLHNQLLLDKTIKIIANHKNRCNECFAGVKEAIIYQTGDVSFCEFYRSFGNLADFDFDFKKLWDSQVRKSNMKFIKNCYCLHSCNLSTNINYSEKFIIRSIQNQGLFRSAFRTAKRSLKAKLTKVKKGLR